MTHHILTIDDDALIRRSLAFLLEQAGYRVSAAGSAEDGLSLAQSDPPDLVLLDIGLPGMDGLDALQRLRGQSDAPVIFLTARRRELEQALGLELGADDYVTKPFDSTVLLARIKAVLRRYQRVAPAAVTSQLAVGDLVIDTMAHSVTAAGAPLELSPREFDLLLALAQQAGAVLTADELLTTVWGPEFVGEPQVLYVHMRRLREKVEAEPSRPQRLVTVRGVGYKLV
jgi:DNA-binding response OmpR family regulator